MATATLGKSGHDWDVFISHNRKQKQWVREVANQWRGLGLKVFFDEDCIEPGEPIDYGIERGIKGSRHIILVLSPESVNSRWVALEISMAVYFDPDARDRKIIPLLLEKTEVAKIRLPIRRLNFVDLTDP